MHFDAIIVGAGPAGATAALNLAPFHRVLLLEAEPHPRDRIGESLPGAARRLLSDMGLFDGFLSDGHLPRHALESAWGQAQPDVRDAISDPDGHGWQIDRVRFEGRLRCEAVRRGATLLAPARLTAIAREGGLWRATVRGPHGIIADVASVLLLDASGRGSRALASLTGRSHREGRMTCFWVRAIAAALPAGVVHIHAESEGWWYAAGLPNGEAILAFHTDSDLPAARATRSQTGLMARARETPRLSALLGSGDWNTAVFGICAADGARRERVSGKGWMAVGDAAIAFDPLAAQGLFNALYLGLAAAEAGSRALGGDPAALAGYAAEVEAIWAHYASAKTAWYGLERRWPNYPFWARRLPRNSAPPAESAIGGRGRRHLTHQPGGVI